MARGERAGSVLAVASRRLATSATALMLLASMLLVPLGLRLHRFGRGPGAERVTWAGLIALGLFSSLIALTFGRDVALAFAASRWLDPRWLDAFTTASAGIVPVAALAITALGFLNARRRARVREVRVPIRDLPEALHGFSIVQISDVHVGPTIKHPYVEAIVDAVNALDADLIAVTDYGAHPFDRTQASDPAGPIAGAPDDAGVKGLLAHQPRTAFAAAKAGFDLRLSGHTHGGQFVPWNFVVRLWQPFATGLDRLEDLWIYTSRGTGYWGPPKRLGAPSEITRIRLVPARRASDASRTASGKNRRLNLKRRQAHFIVRSAATSSGRMIHSDWPSPASGASRAVDSVNHQQGAPLPFCGGAYPSLSAITRASVPYCRRAAAKLLKLSCCAIRDGEIVDSGARHCAWSICS